MQRYTEIPSSTTLTESLPMILANDKSAISCHSGSAFPVDNLHVGMLCYRIDQEKLYILTDTEKETWRIVTQADGDSYLLAGKNGTSINYSKRNLDSWNDMPTGFYQGTNMLNAPEGDTNWRVLQFRENDTNGSSTQLAFGANSKTMKIRYQTGGNWSEWYDIAMSKDGQISKGLNSDLLRDKYPSNEAGQIAINNSTLNKNLNADLLDGYHASNKAGDIPINNGVMNEGLNADTLHEKKPGNAKDNIPINNGKLNVGLNAEMIGGVKIEGLLTTNQENSINRETIGIDNILTKNIKSDVVTAKKLIADEALLYKITPREFEGSKIKESKVGWNGVYTRHCHNSGARDCECGGSQTSYSFGVYPAIDGGKYSLYEIIQKLIDMSHKHDFNSKSINCNCNCNCTDDGR